MTKYSSYFILSIQGKEVVDFIVDYLTTIRTRRTFPDVQPGYMKKLVPESAPENGEKWEDIFKDVERVILPGVGLNKSYLVLLVSSFTLSYFSHSFLACRANT